MAFSVFSVLAGNTSYADVSASNASQQPITGLYGYRGNDVFYLTTAIRDNAYCFYYLPNITGKSASQTCLTIKSPGKSCTCNKYLTDDANTIASGSNISFEKNCSISLEESYNPQQNSMCLRIPVTTLATSITDCEQGSSGVYLGKASVWRVGVIYNVSKSIQSNPNDNGFCLLTVPKLDAGYNITNLTTKIASSNSSIYNEYGEYLSYVSDAAYALSLLSLATGQLYLAIPAYLVGAITTLYSLSNIDTSDSTVPYSTYGFTDIGRVTSSGEAAYVLMPVSENTGKCCVHDETYRALNNTISFTTFAQLRINKCDFSDSGTLNISGLNQMWVTGCSAQCTNPSTPINGSKSNLSIPISPAYTISGTVSNSSGQALSGQKVRICDNTNDTAYVVITNSTGHYRFFAKPDCDYTVSLCSDTDCARYLSASSTNNEGGNTSVNFILPYTVNFIESGLHGNTWSVTLNWSGVSQTIQSSSDEITFHVPYNLDKYTINPVAGYSSSPSSGTLDLRQNSYSYTQLISFTPTIHYTVTFSSGGSNKGDPWAITLNGTTEQSESNTISFKEPNGYFSWRVSSATERVSDGTITYVWSGSPDSGTVNVDGGSASISTTLTLEEVIDNFGGGGKGGGGCVNSTTEILMANFTYMQARYIVPGDYVMSYNITTHQYQPAEVMTTYMTPHHTTQYTINGILQTSKYQPILTNHGYVEAGNLTTNDYIYNAITGTFQKVFSISVSHGNFTMYDFQIPPDYDFIAYLWVVYDLTIKP